MRRPTIDRLIEARFPAAQLRFSGGDEDDERAAEEMRRAAAAERRRLEALSDPELEAEMEFAGPASTPPEATESTSAPRSPAVVRQEKPLPAGPKTGAAIEALRARYGDTRPKGVSAKTMLAQLNAAFAAEGKDRISEKTLTRAKKALWPPDPN